MPKMQRMIKQQTLQVQTRGRGTYDITRQVEQIVHESTTRNGLCHLFIQHTSASLILCENADPSVRDDLEVFMARLIPDGDPTFEHIQEGPDDMPAHLRSILTNMDLTLPISNGRCALGTWQGIFLWEHRTHPHQRQVIITIQGN